MARVPLEQAVLRLAWLALFVVVVAAPQTIATPRGFGGISMPAVNVGGATGNARPGERTIVPLPLAELVSVERIWDGAPHNGFTDLMRFRGGPQDLPHAPALLVVLLGAGTALDLAIGHAISDGANALARSLLSSVVVLGLCWVALAIRRLPHRYVQTASALLACSLVFSLVQLPIALLAGPPPATAAELSHLQILLGWLTLALFVWQISVDAHIMRVRAIAVASSVRRRVRATVHVMMIIVSTARPIGRPWPVTPSRREANRSSCFAAAFDHVCGCCLERLPRHFSICASPVPVKPRR